MKYDSYGYRLRQRASGELSAVIEHILRQQSVDHLSFESTCQTEYVLDRSTEMKAKVETESEHMRHLMRRLPRKTAVDNNLLRENRGHVLLIFFSFS